MARIPILDENDPNIPASAKVASRQAWHGRVLNEQLVDLCLTVGLSNMINRFHASFRCR